ncbi:protein-L-isoaspartate(D-aspartate) O-methyltransferase [Rhizobium leucaenae]|uniref:protein-L-isoaspartate(D-aspartate) O-methyltransferase n=1 Tax=Rhizobium leucaenae TaxID=29450 RepID=UPI001607EA6A|nr:protein-L-isoaspartate(D-aspartate) O-methyltransferase [Rhizobium leucaenae]MBB6300637.1 protein-L-isoaspartate(D-aspartate) O-methyltransferase [Rhizobium leucaenae]
MVTLSRARDNMVEYQLQRRGISDRTVTKAMRTVPREVFVNPGFEEFAYEDTPLAINEGQTISQPFIVALMIEKADIEPNDRVLEIGTGSGYAAAVMSRIARHVYTIERHAALAEEAKQRFQRLGYRNIEVRVGDGSKGWPKAAPFDAIVVTAGGPSVPQSLKDQLDLGGRLIIPVGGESEQRLLRVTRTGADTFDEDDLGGVRFVPLIGAEGWTAEHSLYTRAIEEKSVEKLSLPELIAKVAEDLPPIEDPAFGRLFDRFGDRRVVMLGEATHGTSEFYQARAAITRHLIEHHGFNIVVVEADWPDAAAIDRYIRQRSAQNTAEIFRRFPRWMWRNAEFSAFVAWMRESNGRKADPALQTAFYGLDLYNMSGSIATVLKYLDKTDPDAAAIARERYGCLTPWQNDPATYGRAALSSGYRTCEEAVLQQCRDLLQQRLTEGPDGDEFLDAAQSAKLLASAERYYRIMYYGGRHAWNLRDSYMAETLEHLLDARGPDAKAVVWAHNSHIGDARHTDMGVVHEEVNLGQLCRQRFEGETAAIGFGTHDGQVAAASDWDGEMKIKDIAPSLSDSYERLCHDSRKPRFLLDFDRDQLLHDRLVEQRLERFIGVIYRPETERMSHYMLASLPQQYDAFVWFDHTHPIRPLDCASDTEGTPDTFPFGL